MTIFAIDPGPTESAYVVWDGTLIGEFGKVSNDELATICANFAGYSGFDRCVIEKIASYGMPVGEEVFETCVWTGRFMQAFGPAQCDRLPRKDVKMHLCGNNTAKDSNIRQALIDRFGGPAQIKKGGTLYGISGDVWAALAVAVTWWDRRNYQMQLPSPKKKHSASRADANLEMKAEAEYREAFADNAAGAGERRK